MSAVKTLLDSAIDYAGLFPPAKLGMPEAVRAYADYSRGKHRAFLGRFVCPLARLSEFEAAFTAVVPARLEKPWELSVLAGADAATDAATIATFNARQPSARIASVETKAASPDEIPRATAAFPATLEVWVEIPVVGDIGRFITAIKAAGRGAKIRTGGVTAEAFPHAQDIARFFQACHAAGVPAKATAGLHHPLRGDYRLTYDRASAKGAMYGFMNVFVAAALVRAGKRESEVVAALEDRDRKHFEVGPDNVRFRRQTISVADLAATRRELCRSFGSCSFTEPIEGLQELGWL
jgi:hypothetical protein